jgi:hypothetical protein
MLVLLPALEMWNNNHVVLPGNSDAGFFQSYNKDLLAKRQ